MIKDKEIRLKLEHLLANRLSLDDFEDWLVQNSWNMHRDTDEATQQLVSDIELRLAEYSEDHLDEHDLRRELYSILVSGSKMAIKVAVSGLVTESRTAVISNTYGTPLPTQLVSLGSGIVTSSQTFSAAGCTKQGDELLEHAT